MQRVYRLLVVAQCLSHRANNSCLRVAAQTSLQDACHLTVTVIDESLCVALTQLVDHIRQCKQRPIDIAALSKPETVSMRFINTLAACQVNQIQLGDLDLGRSLLGLALDVDAEDGVTAT